MTISGKSSSVWKRWNNRSAFQKGKGLTLDGPFYQDKEGIIKNVGQGDDLSSALKGMICRLFSREKDLFSIRTHFSRNRYVVLYQRPVTQSGCPAILFQGILSGTDPRDRSRLNLPFRRNRLYAAACHLTGSHVFQAIRIRFRLCPNIKKTSYKTTG